MYRTIAVSLVLLGSLFTSWLIEAAEPVDKTYSPHIAAASGEAAKAMKRFRVPKGMETRVWAAEPLLANPVSFCFDEKGAVMSPRRSVCTTASPTIAAT